MKETIDFILKFTNKTVECFVKSEFAEYEIEEIKVVINEKNFIKQHISNRLWNTYRGTQASPHVLESIHMALEKFFLERGKNTDSKTLEYWLLYLLKNSKSASITAVVASIVSSYPEKAFNVAKILFQTKEFFLYDTSRLVLDQVQKGSLLMLKNNFGVNYNNKIHKNERLKACDDKHRKWSLEHLFLNYQVFRSEETSEEEVEKRQKVLWKILDTYYKELPDKSKETESDKTWKLFLARMDRRNMNPTTEKTGDGLLIDWNPKIEPELKEYSKKSLQKNSESMKYTSLKLWVSYKIRNDEKCTQYEKYEKNPKLALKEVQEIVKKIEPVKASEFLQTKETEEENFFNHSIPSDVCSVLVRDYFEKLLKKEKVFCKDIILETASSSFREKYQYQISDGIESSIFVLPILLNEFPKEKETIKTILLLILFDSYPIGMYGGQFSSYSIKAILSDLWEKNFEDAQSILFGYLFLKPKYEALREKIRQENYKKQHENKIIEFFLRENETNLQKVVDNQLSLDEIGDIEQLDLHILKTAFQLIPLRTDNKEHKEIIKKITATFVGKLLTNNREDSVDYQDSHDFLEKLSYFVLSSQKEEIQEYLKPFIDNFNGSESIADLFKEFISAEDYLNSYENFWEVWDLFKNKVMGLCKKGDKYWYVDKIVKSYLFAHNPWKETATEWHTLKSENKRFFKETSQKIGHCPSVLYAISKLLNDIGSSYLNDGISWVSYMLQNNKNLVSVKIETNTVYYLENFVKKYIYGNREKIKKTKKLKQEVLIILYFLIEKGSVIGYMLRENIL